MRWSAIEKTVFTPEYETFIKRLREAHQAAGLTQEEVAQRLGSYQRLVSRCLTGERRMDIIEVRAFCKALNISFSDFAVELDRALAKLEG